MSKPNQRGKGMKPKIKTISPEELKNFLEKEALLADEAVRTWYNKITKR